MARNTVKINIWWQMSIAFCFCILHVHQSIAFTTSSSRKFLSSSNSYRSHQQSSTNLGVWWFGGTPHAVDERDECELVAVLIERTSSNSRRIWGEIEIPKDEATIPDVWAILTDYDRLSVHVPNLVESIRQPQPSLSDGEQGDGQYSCRLYQKGSQNIVGFEFGASVTMDMKEKFHESGSTREILFKCVDSVFFNEFDGSWKVEEGVSEDGFTSVIKVLYLVDVRPKGPVPVSALEWRIREDVPTNLRAVKKAAIEVGEEGVANFRKNNNAIVTSTQSFNMESSSVKENNNKNRRSRLNRVRDLVTEKVNESRSSVRPGRRLAPVRVTNNFEDDETMARYLRKRN